MLFSFTFPSPNAKAKAKANVRVKWEFPAWFSTVEVSFSVIYIFRLVQLQALNGIYFSHKIEKNILITLQLKRFFFYDTTQYCHSLAVIPNFRFCVSFVSTSIKVLLFSSGKIRPIDGQQWLQSKDSTDGDWRLFRLQKFHVFSL